MYEELTKAVMMRAKAKMLEDEAKTLKEEANDVLGAMMPAYNLKDYGVKGIGKVTLKTNRGSSVNRKKLTESLFVHGVEPGDIADILEKSSTTWERIVIEFKEGGD